MRAIVGLTRPPRTAKSSDATVPNTRVSRLARSAAAATSSRLSPAAIASPTASSTRPGADRHRARVDDPDALRVDLARRQPRRLDGARHRAGDVHRDHALAVLEQPAVGLDEVVDRRLRRARHALAARHAGDERVRA